MAVTVPTTKSTGVTVTAAIWNEHVAALAHLLSMRLNGAALSTLDSDLHVGPYVGFLQPYLGGNDLAPAWLICDGKTVGNGSSGATKRANSDMELIFNRLWLFGNLDIFTSTGGASSRGGSAAADWSANKRMALPDLRGRGFWGMDDLGGTSANRVTAAAADGVAGTFGQATHTLTESEMPAHTHAQYARNSIAYDYQIGGTNPNNAVEEEGHPSNIRQTGSAGGGNAHNNMPPAFFGGWLIYTGN